MTEPTIKEKMAKIIRERTSELSKPFYSDDDLAQILTKIQNAILKDFARLICEEMMDDFDPEEMNNFRPGNQYQTEFAKARGWNQREEKIRNKTQEILKALE